MNKDNAFLGTEPVGKLLFKMAVPTVVAQIINMLYNLVDRIYIGHMPGNGDLALTGVGVCLPIIMIVSAFAALVGAGGAPRISIFMGKGDKDSAEKTMGSCFTLLIVLSLLLTAGMLIWREPILRAFGASDNTIDYAMQYMTIYAIGTLFVQVTLGMNCFITAQGFSKTSMLTVLIGAVCNIILDPIFIYAFHMGVRGAALATIISQSISCVWVIVFLSGKKTILRLKASTLPLRLRLAMPCVALGLAPFVMQASESILVVCFNSSLLKYGGDPAVGAMTILSSLMLFVSLPLMGIGQGAQPVISYNFGAEKPERVRKAFRLLLLVSVLFATTLWAAVMLFPRAFASIFIGSSGEALLDYTVKALRVYCAVIFVLGIQNSCQMCLVATGNVVSSVVVAVVRKFVLLIPLIYILPHLFRDQTMAVYAAEPVADILAVTFTVILFTVQFKKIMKKIQPQEPSAE